MSHTSPSGKRELSASLSSVESSSKRPRHSAGIQPDNDHSRQDQEVEKVLQTRFQRKNLDEEDEFHLHEVLRTVVSVAEQQSDRSKHLSTSGFFAPLWEKPEGLHIIREAVRSGSFKEIRNHDVFQMHQNAPTTAEDTTPQLQNRQENMDATFMSWNEPYVGTAASCVYEIILSYLEDTTVLYYAQYTAIVQSSGTGKSRMVDEMAKNHVVISINLRFGSDGFPPADTKVRSFFSGDETTPVHTAYLCRSFLTALFRKADDYLANINQRIQDHASEEMKSQSLAEKFRFLMTTEQTFKTQGPLRNIFYDEVHKLAEKIYDQSVLSLGTQRSTKSESKSSQPDDKKLLDAGSKQMLEAATELVGLIQRLSPEEDHEQVLIISFDESHWLARDQEADDIPTWSHASVLRRVLREINHLRIFSLFLSTTGKVADFLPANDLETSARIKLRTLAVYPPITEVEFEFDQLMKESTRKPSHATLRLSGVTSNEFISMLGRPLFGTLFKHGDKNVRQDIVMVSAEKLTATGDPVHNSLSQNAKLACIAVRLALEFNATTLASREKERILVEKHLRICLTINPRFQSVVTVAASEPLLAEGACLVMGRDDFNLPASLLVELESPGLDKGDRGELISLVLLTLARDNALKLAHANSLRHTSVIDFIKTLLASKWHKSVFDACPSRSRTDEESERTFKETFKGSRIYFNHFIKVLDYHVINRRFLWMLIARGAAVLCANNQAGVDVIIPFTYKDDTLAHTHISAILIQDKNDDRFTTKPQIRLFDAMNPYFLRFYDMDEEDPLPVIRMVFALAASGAIVQSIAPATCKPPGPQAKGSRSKVSPPYTAYDIWCAKASRDTFAPITENEEMNDIYQSLLKVTKIFPQVYETRTSEECRRVMRTMNPGTAKHPDHWSAFMEADENQPTNIVGADESEVDFDQTED